MQSEPLTADEIGTAPLARMSLQALSRTSEHFTNTENRTMIDLNPPYQRGSVWDTPRRQRLIRSVLMGLPIGAIVTNQRRLNYVVIDGKQRVETLRAFYDGEFGIPNIWVEDRFFTEIERPADPAALVTLPELGVIFTRYMHNRPIAELGAWVATIAEEAEIYRLINTGGVEQSDDDLERAAAIEGR